jgi:hypothetical protein
LLLGVWTESFKLETSALGTFQFEQLQGREQRLRSMLAPCSSVGPPEDLRNKVFP